MGSRPNGSGYSQAAYDVETQNDDKLDGLLGKVKILKDVSQLDGAWTGVAVGSPGWRELSVPRTKARSG